MRTTGIANSLALMKTMWLQVMSLVRLAPGPCKWCIRVRTLIDPLIGPT